MGSPPSPACSMDRQLRARKTSRSVSGSGRHSLGPRAVAPGRCRRRRSDLAPARAQNAESRPRRLLAGRAIRYRARPLRATHLHAAIVPEQLHRAQLVDFLETQFPDSDRIAIRRAVLAGDVQVNGQTARIRLRLHAGEQVNLATPLATRRASQALPESSGVLYESASLIIV